MVCLFPSKWGLLGSSSSPAALHSSPTNILGDRETRVLSMTGVGILSLHLQLLYTHHGTSKFQDTVRYREREKERDRDIYIYIYVYTFICIYLHISIYTYTYISSQKLPALDAHRRPRIPSLPNAGCHRRDDGRRHAEVLRGLVLVFLGVLYYYSDSTIRNSWQYSVFLIGLRGLQVGIMMIK